MPFMTAKQIIDRLLQIQANNNTDVSGLNIEAKLYGLVVKENMDLIIAALKYFDRVGEQHYTVLSLNEVKTFID